MNKKEAKHSLDRLMNTDYGGYHKAISNAKIDFCVRAGEAIDKYEKLTDDKRSELKEDIMWEMETLVDDFERARNEHTSPPLKKKL